ITHPWMAGAFHLGGSGEKIKICGGPQRSIQVNSTNSNAANWSGNPTVNLSQAGPNDPGDCSAGTGADFGDFGGPNRATVIAGGLLSPMGATEHYIQPADPILDPFASVTPPTQPANAASPIAIANGVDGCTSSVTGYNCKLYFPGTYTSDIS